MLLALELIKTVLVITHNIDIRAIRNNYFEILNGDFISTENAKALANQNIIVKTY